VIRGIIIAADTHHTGIITDTIAMTEAFILITTIAPIAPAGLAIVIMDIIPSTAIEVFQNIIRRMGDITVIMAIDAVSRLQGTVLGGCHIITGIGRTIMATGRATTAAAVAITVQV